MECDVDDQSVGGLNNFLILVCLHLERGGEIFAFLKRYYLTYYE